MSGWISESKHFVSGAKGQKEKVMGNSQVMPSPYWLEWHQWEETMGVMVKHTTHMYTHTHTRAHTLNSLFIKTVVVLEAWPFRMNEGIHTARKLACMDGKGSFIISPGPEMRKLRMCSLEGRFRALWQVFEATWMVVWCWEAEVWKIRELHQPR